MTRVRIGLVGLSTASKSTNWAAHAHLPFLQSEIGKRHFEIVALCNSSIASGEKSKAHYHLPDAVKTYDSPENLAQDPDVDLVVNVTGVAQHHAVLLPAARAGKDVYTELPLAQTVAQMKELVAVAREKKIRTVFGMQGQTSSVTTLLRKVIQDDGAIGKVLSTSWNGAGMMFGAPPPVPVGMKQWLMRETGADFMTVLFLHTFNHVCAVLGQVETYQAILGNQRPVQTIVDPEQDGKVVDTIDKDTPDHVTLHGRFQDSRALFSYHLRGGPPFPGTDGLVWSIYGDKGELRITAPSSLIDISHDGVEIQLHTFSDDKESSQSPRTLHLPRDEMETSLPDPQQSVGRIYMAYLEGRKASEGRSGAGYPTWEMGFKLHELIEDMYGRSAEFTCFGEPVKSL